MRKASSRNDWIQGLFTVATLCIGTFIGATLFVEILK